ncbi:MAG: DUF3849 domain-containing protein [Turicibacter sp.]|nr:DUF3849 domain-containing protein [Turicibacter sp.]
MLDTTSKYVQAFSESHPGAIGRDITEWATTNPVGTLQTPPKYSHVKQWSYNVKERPYSHHYTTQLFAQHFREFVEENELLRTPQKGDRIAWDGLQWDILDIQDETARLPSGQVQLGSINEDGQSEYSANDSEIGRFAHDDKNYLFAQMRQDKQNAHLFYNELPPSQTVKMEQNQQTAENRQSEQVGLFSTDEPTPQDEYETAQAAYNADFEQEEIEPTAEDLANISEDGYNIEDYDLEDDYHTFDINEFSPAFYQNLQATFAENGYRSDLEYIHKTVTDYMTNHAKNKGDRLQEIYSAGYVMRILNKSIGLETTPQAENPPKSAIVPLYKSDFLTAKKNGEKKLFSASQNANEECFAAIKSIKYYDENLSVDEQMDEVVAKFGLERVSALIVADVRNDTISGRSIETKHKEWANSLIDNFGHFSLWWRSNTVTSENGGQYFELTKNELAAKYPFISNGYAGLSYPLVNYIQNAMAQAELQQQAEQAAPTETPPPPNFRITNNEIHDDGLIFGAKTKFRDNVNAIETLLLIESENRHATAEEQTILSKYVGWGGIQKAFDGRDYNWQDEFAELKSLLSEEDYKAARNTVSDSFYTSPIIINAIYQGLEHIGILSDPNNGDKLQILEPSMGVGNFFGLMPEEIAQNADLHGVELDPISARIAKKLYPQSQIINSGYEKTFAENNFDIVVGNLPFGDFAIDDTANPEISRLRLKGDKHLLAKTIAQLRPGGVSAVVVPTSIMNGFANIPQNSINELTPLHRYLMENTQLLGAMRLPNNAFNTAGTSATSDILFIQKRPEPLENLAELEPIREEILSWNPNMNFSEDSPMLLGDLQYNYRYGETICVPKEGHNLADDLTNAIQHLKPIDNSPITTIERNIGTFAKAEGDLISLAPTKIQPIDNAAIKPNNYFFVENEQLFFHKNTEEPVLPVDKDFYETEFEVKQISKHPQNIYNFVLPLINIRDAAKALITAQADPTATDEQIANLRENLNTLYDDFRKKDKSTSKTGKIGLHSAKVAKYFGEDSSYPLLLSLEQTYREANAETGLNEYKVGKSDIFSERTTFPHITPTHAESPDEAAILSMQEFGYLNVEYMQSLLETSETEIFDNDLMATGYVYKNVVVENNAVSYQYQLKSDFLSGNIVNKIETHTATIAELEKMKIDFNANPSKIAELDEIIATAKLNLSALENVLPEPIIAEDIDFSFGATWIPEKYVNDFIAEQTNAAFSRYDHFVKFNKSLNAWVDGDRKFSAASSKYSTEKISDKKLFLKTLNMQAITIKEPGKDEKILLEETEYIRQIQEQLHHDFREWLYSDPTRKADIQNLYNRQYNNIVNKEFNGDNLKLHGANAEIKLEKHQRDVVIRILQGGNTLVAHAVGAGKTYSLSAAVKEGKRMGKFHKPVILTPKPVTTQFAEHFMKLYPTANILVATPKDLTDKHRDKFLNKIATNNYDAVIMSHEQFEKIPLKKETIRASLQEKLDDLENALSGMDESNSNEKSTVKAVVKQMEDIKNKIRHLEEIAEEQGKNSKTLYFEDLGIDFVGVDEAHKYKNLSFNTKLENVAGLGSASNAAILTDGGKLSRNQDMYEKIRYINKKTNYNGVVFATGTPVTNSIAEVYILQKYLNEKALHEQGIYSFDDWCGLYARPTTNFEITPESPKRLKEKSRFREFTNLPELALAFSQIADIKMAEDLNLPAPEYDREFIIAKQDKPTKAYMLDIVKRAEKMQGSYDPKEDNMLKLVGDASAVALDMRLRVANAPDNSMGKANLLVEQAVNIWAETQANKSVQIIFCDTGTPKDSFNVYSDIREKLIAQGVPAAEIAFIHEHDSESKRAKLFEEVNNGNIRFLLGSTEKLGTGVNVQNKLYALHHVDVPWRPSDMEQREGRILRWGNENPRVKLFQYIMEGSFDAYRYQLLENKSHMINQVITNKIVERKVSEIESDTMTAAHAKALASNNKLLLDYENLKKELQTQKILQSQFEKDQDYGKRQLQILPNINKALQDDIQAIDADIENLKKFPLTSENPDKEIPDFVIGDQVYNNKKEANEAVKQAITDLRGLTVNKKIGSYRGMEMLLRCDDTLIPAT